jgi:hypothetical protein
MAIGTIDMNITNWKQYKLSALNLSFKLPPQISDLTGSVIEQVTTPKTGGAYTGSAYQAMFTYKNNLLFEVSADSFDFTAGRSIIFSDLSGYSVGNNSYTTKYHSDNGYRSVAIPSKSIVGEITNSNGVHILRVKGVGSTDANKPYDPLYMNKDTLGALINTQNPTYPGIAVFMMKNSTLTQEVFDQILSTFTLMK